MGVDVLVQSKVAYTNNVSVFVTGGDLDGLTPFRQAARQSTALSRFARRWQSCAREGIASPAHPVFIPHHWRSSERSSHVPLATPHFGKSCGTSSSAAHGSM